MASRGHGLVGIRQRAAMYGGAVTVGLREAGTGWIVDVVLDAAAAPVVLLLGDQLT